MVSFPTLLFNFGRYYIPTYIRAFPHLLGILVGYDVATKRRCFTQVINKREILLDKVFSDVYALFHNHTFLDECSVHLDIHRFGGNFLRVGY